MALQQYFRTGKIATLKKLVFFLLVSLGLRVPAVCAQSIVLNGKPDPGVNYTELQQIDSVMKVYLDKNWLKGAETLVIKSGQVIQYKGYGFADVEGKKPMSRDAMFRIMSQTKAITSAAVLILFEQGKLLLDEPVGDFIPEFKHQLVVDVYRAADTSFTTVPAKRDVTIRDLLTHSSGLDYADIGTPMGKAIYAKAGIPSGLGHINGTLLEKMKLLGKLPLTFQPGEKWQYGLNVDLLGCLVEVISGMPLDQFFQQHLFTPLGMKDTYFNVPASKGSRLAAVYTEDSTGKIIPWSHTFRHLDPDYPLHKTSYFSGGAGLTSTAMDYAVFLQMLLNGGIYNGQRILAPRSVQLMTSGQLDFLYNGKDNFGLGFGITSAKSAARNVRNEGAFNWGGYYGTTYWADPKAHLIVLILTQHSPNSHSDLFQKVENIIYSSLLK